MVMRKHPRLCAIVHSHVRPCAMVHDRTRPCMAMHDGARLRAPSQDLLDCSGGIVNFVQYKPSQERQGDGPRGLEGRRCLRVHLGA